MDSIQKNCLLKKKGNTTTSVSSLRHMTYRELSIEWENVMNSAEDNSRDE